MTHSNPLASIIIPTHNEGDWVRRTLQALIINTCYQPFEIIVVDDGSTDGSCDFLKSGLFSRYPLKLIETRGSGVSCARNEGAAHASGDVIVFMDAHVLPDTGWLRELVGSLKDSSVGMVGPAIRTIKDPSAKGYGMIIKSPDLSTRWIAQAPVKTADVPCLGGGCVAIRREVFWAFEGFDPGSRRWGANDVSSSVSCWLLGYRCVVTPDAEVAHLFKQDGCLNYELRWEDVIANLLRTALVLFDGARLTAVIEAIEHRDCFSDSMTSIKGDIQFWERRDVLRRRFIHDADWFFNKFSNLMPDITDGSGVHMDAILKAGRGNGHPRPAECPVCGAFNYGRQMSCLRCRASLDGTQQPAEIDVCAQCGGSRAAHYRFCVHCGTPRLSKVTSL